MHVIGTAGHVDHGKSTLITALTGINPDRLKEEQEREMTIDLGFAWLTLPGGEEIGIVDVPGHRDFIENMLAGSGGVEAAILVIAADEGIMPQTREHLAILDLLQVQDGIVALTKIDLVESTEWLDMVEKDVRSFLLGTKLQEAPILRVSSTKRQGLPELLQALNSLIRRLPARADNGMPRLPIDRVFSISGFGTVVTGTLSGGSLSLHDEVEILPSGLHARIRGLQTHKKKEETAFPGSRVGVNLSGADLDKVQRGEVLTRPGKFQPIRRVDARLHVLPDISKALTHNTEVKVFTGTAETLATLRLLGTETLQQGKDGWIQLELRQPIVAMRGDHYVLRRPSPGETLGGGTIIDPQPKHRHKRFDQAVLTSLEKMEQGSPPQIVMNVLSESGPLTVSVIIERSQMESAAVESAIKELLEAGQIHQLEEYLITDSRSSSLKQTLMQLLSTYHQTYPLKPGMPREELKSRLGVDARIYHLFIDRMLRENIIKIMDNKVALLDHIVVFSDDEKVTVTALLEQFKANPYAPPTIQDCRSTAGDDVVSALIGTGELVTVSEEIVFRRIDYQSMVEQVKLELRQKGTVTLAQVRDIFKTSRRYAQAFLEHLDSIGVTVRQGDSRRSTNQNG